MAFCKLEDHLGGEAEAVVFSDVYAACREHLEADIPLFVTAKIGPSPETEEEGRRQTKLQPCISNPWPRWSAAATNPWKCW